jgi:antitoxin (DNA-binding transcriptional repressor) of toxin-antitoxin stability system
MKTLSITEARANLSAVLERAKKGEEIGIISGNKIVQLKPIEVVPWEESYLNQEYGVKPEEWERFRKSQDKMREAARRKGQLKYFSGDIEKDIAD